MDRLSPERRSWLMARIRAKDTRPEMEVRSALHALGYRYRLHRGDLPGRPDLVFAGRCKVVFVHGCFWHGHACRRERAASKSNVEFWRRKIDANRLRDRRNLRALKKAGWAVKVIWECDLKKQRWLAPVCRFLDH